MWIRYEKGAKKNSSMILLLDSETIINFARQFFLEKKFYKICETLLEAQNWHGYHRDQNSTRFDFIFRSQHRRRFDYIIITITRT